MKSEHKKIAIYIPARNAAATLPIVLDRIPDEVKKKVREIFVVDNASRDNSYLTVIGYKKEKNLSNLRVMRNKEDKGYGGSQKIAYEYAINKGYDIIVMLHGDAQYAPEMLPFILKPLEEGTADMVFGSRMKGDPLKGGMPMWKLIGNKSLTWIENKVLKLDLSEFHSGYRAFSVKALKKVPFKKCDNDYHFDTDILIQFKIKGLRIRETPIPTHYGEESHSPSPWQLVKYTLNILKSLLEYELHIAGIKKKDKFDVK